jgi:hypothetical protein
MNTDKNVNELIEQLKKASPDIAAQKVKALIESGKHSPFVAKRAFQPRRINQFFNPFKILVMITPIVIITSALLIWNPIIRLDKKDPQSASANIGTEQVRRIRVEEQSRLGVKEAINLDYRSKNKSTKMLVVPDPNARQAVNPTVRDTQLTGVILDLTKEELTRLGFMFDEEGYYYLNKLPDGTRMNCWSWHTTKDKTSTIPLGVLGNADIKSGGGSVGWGSGSWVNKDNKSPLHDFDFYPVITTDLNGESVSPIELVAVQAKKSFELMNDTLVPVLFSRSKLGGYDTEDKLVWFKVSDQFFDLLKTEESEKAKDNYNIAKGYAQNRAAADRVFIDYVDYFHQPFTVKLKPQVLECFGIVLSKDRVDYQFTNYGTEMKWWVDQSGIGVNNYSMKAWGGQEMIVHGENGIPLTITDGTKAPDGNDNKGKCPMIFAISRKFNGNTVGLGDYLSDLDLMVPVQIDDPEASGFLKELIIWIYPTEQFFSCLPSDIADQMRKEFNYQLKRLYPDFVPSTGGSIGFTASSVEFKGGGLARDTVRMGGSIGISEGDQKKASVIEDIEPVPCVYFTNLCESLSGLDYVNLYPNPATDKLNVDLVLAKAKMIRFRVIDMGGRVITDYGTTENYTEGGQFKHQIDVSDLQSGLYMLVMTDEEGGKVSKRFVKN